MKSIVVLCALNVREYACCALFNTKSAVEKAADWAVTVPDVSCVAVLESSHSPEQLRSLSVSAENITFKHISQEKWTIALFLQTLADISEGYDAVVFGFADAPFYDAALTKKLLHIQHSCGAEYTFADGYPAGFAPEIINPGTLRILAGLAKDNAGEVTRTVLFDVFKTDINAFEIETDIAPKDLRYLRVSLSCDTKRNMMQCSRLFDLMEQNPETDLCTLLENAPDVLRTLPAFYAVQIASSCVGKCSFCPYPQAATQKYGKNPADCHEYMTLDTFRDIVAKIADFSDDAVISLSLWGEPLDNPQFVDFVQTVLAYPALSVLIETSGVSLTAETVSALSAAVSSAPERTNGQKPVNWIVSLDAANAELYTHLHGTDNFAQAFNAVEQLFASFPGAVYPQFVRINENEAHMEQFYRFWKEKCGSVIIQKYDNFCGTMQDCKVADLTPVHRNPCWHLRRDMCILLDGSVPVCKEAVLNASCGNVCTDSLETIWKKNDELFASHLNRTYKGLCGNCDEYYTFNF